MSHRKTQRRGSATRGWKRMSPGVTERRKMLAKCGRKCFLGPKMSFPICDRGTCKIDRRGIQSAYNRARQFKRRSIAAKARKLLGKMR